MIVKQSDFATNESAIQSNFAMRFAFLNIPSFPPIVKLKITKKRKKFKKN